MTTRSQAQAQAAHPDLSQFYSIPPPSSSSSTSTAPALPKTPSDLLKLVRSCTNHQSIRDILIPTLERIAAGEGQSGGSKRTRVKNGERLLSLPGITKEFDLIKLSDGEITAMTAALMYILPARFDNPPGDSEWDQMMMLWMMKFVKLHDPEQVRMTKGRMSNLAWSLQRLSKRIGRPPLCIPLILGIQANSYPPSVFAGTHAAVLEACLLDKEYEMPFALINEVPKDFISAGPSYLDVLTYFHHAGMIFAARGDYARARDSFVLALGVPTAAASAIQLACGKRAILCELIVSAKQIKWPKYVASTVTRIMERNADPYTKLAKAFEAHDWGAVEVSKSVQDFKDDCNLGLFQLVLASIPKRKILRVKETFSRMRLDQLASKVGGDPAAISVTLQDMINSNEIQATITPDPSGPIISFLPDPISPPEEAAKRLASLEQEDEWLEANMMRGIKAMGTSQAYLSKQLDMQNVSGKKGGGGPGGRSGGGGGDFGGLSGGAGGVGIRGVGSNLDDMGF